MRSTNSRPPASCFPIGNMFVGKLLKIWGLEASAIPVGQFIDHYRKLGTGPKPAIGTDPAR